LNKTETEIQFDPKKYKCIRCKAPADIIFKNMLPYCFLHEPAESKAARQPKEDEMNEVASTVDETTGAAVVTTIESATGVMASENDGWTVYAKDGSVLCGGFPLKKDASAWAGTEVKAQRLKAGQYKIKK